MLQVNPKKTSHFGLSSGVFLGWRIHWEQLFSRPDAQRLHLLRTAQPVWTGIEFLRYFPANLTTDKEPT